jgi:hypothetical protein
MAMQTDRLVGHALRREGKAFGKAGNQTWYEGGQMGYAVCECGATSERLDSTNARKRWHKVIHKPAMRAEMEKTDGSE